MSKIAPGVVAGSTVGPGSTAAKPAVLCPDVTRNALWEPPVSAVQFGPPSMAVTSAPPPLTR